MFIVVSLVFIQCDCNVFRDTLYFFSFTHWCEIRKKLTAIPTKPPVLKQQNHSQEEQ